MLVRLLIGGVTLAAAGYAAKEYCEQEGCPWDSSIPLSSYKEDDDAETKEKVSYKKSLAFHKQKKAFYKTSMQVYSTFLQEHGLKDETTQTDSKLLKQKFSDTIIDDEISSYMEKITSTLKVLSQNLALSVKMLSVHDEETVDEERILRLQAYAKSIYALAHAPFFLDAFSGKVIRKLKGYDDAFYRERLNKEGLLSTLVEAMSLSVNKEHVYVDLSGALDAIDTATEDETTLQ